MKSSRRLPFFQLSNFPRLLISWATAWRVAVLLACALFFPADRGWAHEEETPLNIRVDYQTGAAGMIVGGEGAFSNEEIVGRITEYHEEEWGTSDYVCYSYSELVDSWTLEGNTQVWRGTFVHPCTSSFDGRPFPLSQMAKATRRIGSCPPFHEPEVLGTELEDLHCVHVNQPPTFLTQVGTQRIAEGQVLRTPAIAVQDPDNYPRPMQFRAEDLPPWAQLNPATGEITGLVPLEASGREGSTHSVTVYASDGDEREEIFQDVILLIENVNRKPALAGAPPGPVDEGQAYSFTLTASDLDTDDLSRLTWNIANQPGWITFTVAPDGQTATLSGTATAGTTSGVVVRVSDGTDSESLTFDIVANTVNQPPSAVIDVDIEEPLGPVQATAASIGLNERVVFSIAEAADPEGQAVAMSWWLNNSEMSTATLVERVFDRPGIYTIELRVSDGVKTSTATFTLDVKPYDRGLNLAAADCNGSNPINHGTGNKYQLETDYVGQGIFPLVLQRHYNSQPLAGVSLGKQWRHSYERALVVKDNQVHAYRHDGQVIRYTFIDNQWRAPAGIGERLEQTPAGWRLLDEADTAEIYDSNGVLVSITERTGFTQTLAYANGLLQQVSDPFGKTLRFEYDPTPRLVNVIDPANQSITFTYNNSGYLAGVTYQDGTRRQYLYEDPALPGALMGIVDERGTRIASYYYDEQGRGVYSGGANGANETTIKYVDDGTAVVTDALGTARTYKKHIVNGQYKTAGIDVPCTANCGGATQNTTFDANGDPDRVTDFRGAVTDYDYDPLRGLEVQRIEAQGTPAERVFQTHWHSTFRLPTCLVEPLRTTELIYTERGQLQARNEFDTSDSAIFPDLNAKSCATIAARPDALSLKQRRWQYQYHATGLLAQVNGPLAPDAQTGQDDITTYTYNGQGQVATVTNALGQPTQFLNYDAHGRVQVMQDENGVYTQLSYDPRGRVVRARTGPGNFTPGSGEVAFSQVEETRYFYDASGLLHLREGPAGARAEYIYDEAQRLIESQDNLGNRQRYTLDKLGNRLTTQVIELASGQVKRTLSQTFDAHNRLQAQVGGPTERIEFSYDANGNLTAQLTGERYRTGFEYDSLNRVSARLTGNNKAIYDYDAHHNLRAVTDAVGLTTRYRYDGLGNLLDVASPDSGVTAMSAYDALGNVLTQTDARGQTTTFDYDALGRLDLITYQDGSQADYGYDQGPNGIGRLTSIVDSSGRTTWAYDPWGRVVSKTQQVGALAFTLTYQYNAQGELDTVTYPSGQVVRYGRTRGVVTALHVNDAPLLNDITYEPFGPINGWRWGNGTPSTRSYNSNGLLTSYSRGPALEATLTYKGGQVVREAAGLTPTLNYNYDTAGRLRNYWRAPVWEEEHYSFALDGNGNRLEFGHRMQDPQADLPSHVLALRDAYALTPGTNQLAGIQGDFTQKAYTYDASGNRISEGATTFEYDPRGRLTSLNNGQYRYTINALGERVAKTGPNETRYFVYDDGGQLVGEYDANGNAIHEIVYIAALPVALLQGPTQYYIYADHLNSPRTITRTDNTALWHWDSMPFGQTLPNMDPDGDGVAFTYNLRFPGQYFDQESGLHYNYYRTYDPQTGRYLEPDPIGLAGGLNPYVYADNNPLNYTDARGLFPDAIADIGFIGYDLYRLVKDNLFGDCNNLNENLAALGADTAGLFAPGLTGLGLGIRGVNTATIGGGATLDKLSPGEIRRIQNAAIRSGIDIGVVGSRVNPNKAIRPDSDYDFVINANSKTRSNLSGSLPGSKNARDGLPNNQDIFKGPIDPNRPYVIFHPE